MLDKKLREAPVAPFTFEDFLFVGGKVTKEPERLILVGGQALSTWGVLLDVPSPDGTTLTEDTDWLGSREDAEWLCKQLGEVDLQVATIEDQTPNTALARLLRPGNRVLLMDFLSAIVGPDNDSVRKLAVTVQVEHVRLSVLRMRPAKSS